ncbi:MAG: PqqD family protein [Myxococcales bacterium]|nr:PqqD family protein [Myxococcales bacterium]
MFTELADGTGVVLDLNAKLYFSLNTTGVFIWKLIGREALSPEELASRLSVEFAVSANEALADVVEVLSQCEVDEIVVRHP